MIALAVVAAVIALVWVIARERRIYKANKAFTAQSVQVVSPPAPRWWQPLMANLIVGALIAAAVLALLRYLPADDTTPGPTTPLDGGATDGTAPAARHASSSSSSSSSSAPKGASR